MGKLVDSPLEGTTGRTGRFVIANVGGVEIIRRRPKSTQKSPTDKQLLIRNRFRDATDFMGAYVSYSSLYFGNPIKNRSRHNQASANAMSSFMLDFDNNTWVIDNESLMFSKGKLLPPFISSITSAIPGEIELNWMDNSEGDTERETDDLYVLIAISQTTKALLFKNVAKRVTGTATLELPVRFHNHEIAIWVAFASHKIGKASNSEYFGTITV